MRVAPPARAPHAWPRALLILSAVDWVRETERGANHLSAFLEEGDVVAYQVGTWLLDNVEVGDGSPARLRLARVDHTQLICSAQNEHGVIRGTALAYDDASVELVPLAPDGAGDADGDVDSGEDVEFGPEQLVARIRFDGLDPHLPESIADLLEPQARLRDAPLRKRAPPPQMREDQMTMAVPANARMEARVSVDGAGERGRGAYAAEPIEAGDYRGELLDADEASARYARSEAENVFDLGGGRYIDGGVGEHWSRYVNHAERANLEAVGEDGGIALYATRRVPRGGELLLDYGVSYWARRSEGPLPSTDSRLGAIGARRAVRRGADALRRRARAADAVWWTLLLPLVVPLLGSAPGPSAGH